MAAAFATTAGCGSSDKPSSTTSHDGQMDSTIQAVATVGMVADLVRQVGGARVNVHQMMGPGVDPHLYKGTRDDVRAILAADMIFYSGLLLEGKLAGVLEKVGRRKPSLAVTSAIDPKLISQPADDGEHADPHVWMDVSLWAHCVDAIAASLSAHDPGWKRQYRDASAAYQSQLMDLHRYGQRIMETIPPAGRVLVTSHDAFHYFGKAYGLDVFGVQGLSTDSEAGLMQINQLVDMIVRRRVTAVFVESSVPRKSVLAVIDGAAARGQRLVIGGELYSDAMGAMGTYEGTYLGMMDHNLTTVARALGGNVPVKGFNEKLSLGLSGS